MMPIDKIVGVFVALCFVVIVGGTILWARSNAEKCAMQNKELFWQRSIFLCKDTEGKIYAVP